MAPDQFMDGFKALQTVVRMRKLKDSLLNWDDYDYEDEEDSDEYMLLFPDIGQESEDHKTDDELYLPDSGEPMQFGLVVN